MDEISKTQRKKTMLALQVLGEELVTLNHEQLAELCLPERLLEAIVEAKGLTKFGARKRQLQFIGRLMREVDAQPIREKLESLRGQSREHAAWLHKVERWRDRLLSDEDELAVLLAGHPEADAGRLRELVRDSRSDTAAAKRSYRELFQELRRIFPRR